MKPLVTLIALVAVTFAVGVVAAQALRASPSTSIAPITVERAGPDRNQNEPDRMAKEKKEKKKANPKRRDPTPSASTGGAEPVTPTPLPAGDDDDADDAEDDGADDSDDVDDNDGVPD